MECKRCGDCCKASTLFKGTEKEEVIQTSIAIGLIKNRKDFEDLKCPHLEFVMGLAVCKINDTKPQFCRDFYCDKCKEI